VGGTRLRFVACRGGNHANDSSCPNRAGRVSLTGTFADAGTWCATYRLGSTNCDYSSSEECLVTVAVFGDFCQSKSIPRDGLRDLRRQLESTRLAKALSARLSARGWGKLDYVALTIGPCGDPPRFRTFQVCPKDLSSRSVAG
jgi:hypothetical protein